MIVPNFLKFEVLDLLNYTLLSNNFTMVNVQYCVLDLLNYTTLKQTKK